MIWGRRTLLDDPVITAWDAAQGGTSVLPNDVDASDIEMIEAFLALDVIPGPSVRFQEELEQRLAGMALAQPAPDRQAAGSIDSSRPPRRLSIIPPDRDGGAGAHRWIRLTAAAAVLALVALAGLLVLYRAVPAPSEVPAIPAVVIPEPELQTMVQFDFDPPMWGMPDATTWTHMDFSIIELAPGNSFDTSAYWYTSAQGPLLLMVLSGELSMQPAGPALFYPDVEQRHSPEAISPRTPVAMTANSAIAYSITDTGTGNNPGSVPMVALIGLTGKEDLSLPYSMPTEVRSLSFEYVDGMPVPPTKGASVSIQRLRLAPFDSYVFDLDPNWRYLPAIESLTGSGLQLVRGAVDGISPDMESVRVFSSSSLQFPAGTAYTLFNLGEEPVDIYFFVVEPYPNSATPAP